MAFADGTVVTTARPREFRDTRIPRPNGGSESEPIRFGAKSRASVFNADMAGIERLRKSAMRLLDMCERKPDSMVTLGSRAMAPGMPGPGFVGAEPHTGRVRGTLGTTAPPGNSSGYSCGAKLFVSYPRSFSQDK